MRVLGTVKAIVRKMCEVYIKGRKSSKNLMQNLGLDNVIKRLAMVNIVHWHWNVLRMEDGHIVRMSMSVTKCLLIKVSCRR